MGPLLDEHNISLARSNKANTNSLESIDSNPRQAVPRGDQVSGEFMTKLKHKV